MTDSPKPLTPSVKQEQWRSVPGSPKYAVSNLGRVRGVYGKILKGVPDRRGYLCVSLSDWPQRPSKFIHQLVAFAFLGPRPSSRHQVAHLDGIKTNNCLTNLTWMIDRENDAMKREHGTLARGERHGEAKLTEAQVLEIRKQPGTCQALAHVYGVSASTIRRIRKRMGWRHLDG